MKSRSNELLDRATSAMIAAIELYNKPGFRYRTESFTILAINGWELLIKAKWLAEHGNDERSLFVQETRENVNGRESKKKYIKRTRSGNPFTHSIDHLAAKLFEEKKLDPRAWANLQIMIELRDTVMHFYNQSPAFRVRLHEIGAACVKNYATAFNDWFEKDLSEFNLHLMPMTFLDLPTNLDAFLLNVEEKNFLDFLNENDKGNDDPESPYSTTVNIEVRFVRSKAKNALTAQITNDPNAPKIQLTDEQVREKYPWDTGELTKRCLGRYSLFKQNQTYHTIRKGLLTDRRFGVIRFLDPGNPKSAKKAFYNPNILSELDKHYARKDKVP